MEVHVNLDLKFTLLSASVTTAVHPYTHHVHTKPSCSLLKEINLINITILQGVPVPPACVERDN